MVALTVGVGSRRHRRMVRELARHIGYDDHPGRRLPTVSIAGITSDETPVCLPEPISVEGNATLLELLVLARLVKERQPRSLFEIGTFDGRTTMVLAANAPDDARVCTLDLPAGHSTAHSLDPAEQHLVEKPSSGARISGAPAQRVTQLYGDSATFDFSTYACDFVFVDASHAYEYVLNDSRKALEMTREAHGLIVWHDYGEWEGVTRALNELSREAEFSGLRWIEGTTLAILDSRPAGPEIR